MLSPAWTEVLALFSMPPSDHAQRRGVSSELGEGDFAVNYTRSGRPIRKARRTQKSLPFIDEFVDSAVAVSDPIESDDSDFHTIPVSQFRKRKRSPSPPPSDESSEDGDSITSAEDGVIRVETSATPQPALQFTIKDLVIHLPPGHSGPVVIQLDMPSNTSRRTAASVSNLSSTSVQKRSNSKPPSQRAECESTSKNANYAGFLDLPAEIRNQIYEQVFIADDFFNFDSPSNFSRGAAFLRTCKQVYEEGRTILYSENHFVLVRKTRRRGSYWEREWNEVGFKAVRKFLRMVGPTNTGLIRHATLLLEDATPCLNTNMSTADERRFVHDDVLISVLRHLADHCKLRTLELHFHGRRRVERTDLHFLQNLVAIQADEVKFVRTPAGTIYPSESKQGVAVERLCLENMVRKKKLYR